MEMQAWWDTTCPLTLAVNTHTHAIIHHITNNKHHPPSVEPKHAEKDRFSFYKGVTFFPYCDHRVSSIAVGSEGVSAYLQVSDVLCLMCETWSRLGDWLWCRWDHRWDYRWDHRWNDRWRDSRGWKRALIDDVWKFTLISCHTFTWCQNSSDQNILWSGHTYQSEAWSWWSDCVVSETKRPSRGDNQMNITGNSTITGWMKKIIRPF